MEKKTLLIQELSSGFLVRDISNQDPKNQPAFAALTLDAAIEKVKFIVETTPAVVAEKVAEVEAE